MAGITIMANPLRFILSFLPRQSGASTCRLFARVSLLQILSREQLMLLHNGR